MRGGAGPGASRDAGICGGGATVRSIDRAGSRSTRGATAAGASRGIGASTGGAIRGSIVGGASRSTTGAAICGSIFGRHLPLFARRGLRRRFGERPFLPVDLLRRLALEAGRGFGRRVGRCRRRRGGHECAVDFRRRLALETRQRLGRQFAGRRGFDRRNRRRFRLRQRQRNGNRGLRHGRFARHLGRRGGHDLRFDRARDVGTRQRFVGDLARRRGFGARDDRLVDHRGRPGVETGQRLGRRRFARCRLLGCGNALCRWRRRWRGRGPRSGSLARRSRRRSTLPRRARRRARRRACPPCERRPLHPLARPRDRLEGRATFRCRRLQCHRKRQRAHAAGSRAAAAFGFAEHDDDQKMQQHRQHHELDKRRRFIEGGPRCRRNRVGAVHGRWRCRWRIAAFGAPNWHGNALARHVKVGQRNVKRNISSPQLPRPRPMPSCGVSDRTVPRHAQTHGAWQIRRAIARRGAGLHRTSSPAPDSTTLCDMRRPVMRCGVSRAIVVSRTSAQTAWGATPEIPRVSAPGFAGDDEADRPAREPAHPSTR